MPRSLSQAGLNTAPFWVRPEQIQPQPFYVYGATLRNDRYGEQVVFQLRLRDGVFDEDGEHHKNVQVSLAAGGSGQRRDFVSYFNKTNDPLGPCYFNPIPTKEGMNDFWQIADAPAEMLTTRADPPVIPARTSANAADDDQMGF